MLTLYGATGYTGRMAAFYLRDHAPSDLRWAIAGRSASKLAQLKRDLGDIDVDVIVADSADAGAVEAMVARSSVIVTTVGPYALYGSALVAACAQHGVHYCDITGETPWVRDMIDAHHGKAQETGAKIVSFCGMDSVPSDLGAAFMVDAVRSRFGAETREVRAVFQVKGGISGGTVASALNMGAAGETRRLADPVLLNPDSHRSSDERKRNRDRVGVTYDDTLGMWTAPFIMGAVNTRVVRRSAALADAFGERWGASFRYDESVRAPSRAKAMLAAGGLGVFAALTTNAPGRALIGAVAPKPGEGPSEEALAAGYLKCHYIAVSDAGDTLRGLLQADGDPGYRVTITFLCEAGLALALDTDALPGGAARAAVLTPATALGRPYIERLERQGVTFSVVD